MSDISVMPLLLLAYFGAGAATIGLLLFPRARQRLLTGAGRLWTQLYRTFSMMGNASRRVWQGSTRTLLQSGQSGWTTLFRQRYTLLIALAVVAAPVLLALSLGRSHSLAGFEDSSAEPNTVVSWLLRGEQLVPPPPLPPEIFTARDVESVRPALASANRDWGLLDAGFRQNLLHLFKNMEEQHGYRMVLLEGYRDPERQNRLRQMGASTTNAAAWQSYHQYGLAADCAFLRDGKLVISEKDPWAMRGYALLGEMAQAQGLTWGGEWKLADLGHVEMRKSHTARNSPPATDLR